MQGNSLEYRTPEEILNEFNDSKKNEKPKDRNVAQQDQTP
jgi:hypothetical protein